MNSATRSLRILAHAHALCETLGEILRERPTPDEIDACYLRPEDLQPEEWRLCAAAQASARRLFEAAYPLDAGE